jgi:DNA-binding Lrp family transcriptional regulator
MDDKDMKIQALTERIAQDAARTANEIADLRVSLTTALNRVQELEDKYVSIPKKAEEFTAQAVNTD